MLSIRCIHDDPHEQAIIHELVDLDLQYIPGATTENMGSIDYWSACKGADFKFIAEDNGHIVGYVSIYAINQEGEKKVLDGTIDDTKLLGLLETNPKPNVLTVFYIVGAVVKPSHQRRGIAMDIITFARNYFASHAYVYEKIYGIAWSDGGEALLKKAGGRQIGFDVNNHPVYVIH